MRTFHDTPAVREKTPLLVGLVGPSGTGKTFSALRLATGIQRVTGGDVYMIDTEARRGLHYADSFKFRHVAFGAPFAPLDYLAAIEHCVKKGAGVVIVDSMSHEHEGPGGVLEMHAAEVKRMAGNDRAKAERVKMLAWQKPKSDRRRLINSILQMECNFIFCFRAKPKLKLIRNKDPEQLGYMPIAGDEFVYEMTLKCLLLPGSNGVPVMRSEHEGEAGMIKVPGQFRSLLPQHEPPQLSEDIGENLAKWAAGDDAGVEQDLVAALNACSDPATLRKLEADARAAWKRLDSETKRDIQISIEDARGRVADAMEADAIRDQEAAEAAVDGEMV